MTGRKFREPLVGELEDAGREGVRITPDNIVAAAELIKHDRAHPFLNGFGYLCLRSAERSPAAVILDPRD
jgi:hypothetical protein